MTTQTSRWTPRFLRFVSFTGETPEQIQNVGKSLVNSCYTLWITALWDWYTDDLTARRCFVIGAEKQQEFDRFLNTKTNDEIGAWLQNTKHQSIVKMIDDIRKELS